MRSHQLRKSLPAFAVVRGLRVHHQKLLNELAAFGLFDTNYNAARADVDETENLFIKANMVCKQFFNENADSQYMEVNLSKPSFESENLKVMDVLRDRFALYRTKRLDPSRPEYSEHADETRHNIDPKYLEEGSELAHVFAHFKGKPCRVRIARMKSGDSIKPHVDYDPSYVFRYHIPLVTNINCRMKARRVTGPGSTIDYEAHFAADGRVYTINTGILHWAENTGFTDRYHLLIDVTGDLESENATYLGAL